MINILPFPLFFRILINHFRRNLFQTQRREIFQWNPGYSQDGTSRCGLGLSVLGQWSVMKRDTAGSPRPTIGRVTQLRPTPKSSSPTPFCSFWVRVGSARQLTLEQAEPGVESVKYRHRLLSWPSHLTLHPIYPSTWGTGTRKFVLNFTTRPETSCNWLSNSHILRELRAAANRKED